jgi:hypothetical protein
METRRLSQYMQEPSNLQPFCEKQEFNSVLVRTRPKNGNHKIISMEISPIFARVVEEFLLGNLQSLPQKLEYSLLLLTKRRSLKGSSNNTPGISRMIKDSVVERL